jgi:Enoyl-(Acyl carrier protein) reductase
VEKAVWSKRYDLINDFEEMLTQNDTTIQKSLRPSREAPCAMIIVQAGGPWQCCGDGADSSVHSKEASVLKAHYVTAKHGLIGLAKVVAREGAAHGVRANVICPGFVRTPLVDKQIPEQAKELGISEQDVIKNVMLKETVDGEFTTVEDVAEAALFFAAFNSNALTGQSLIVSHGWFME